MELLEIRPRELKFTFELKKQSSCSIQLGNRSDQYVAFKVKTTSPTKYCVRPNIGIVKPKESCDFRVTMQAQKVAPPDLHCKDKFLVQSTVVPFGTTEEDISSDMFSKDSGKQIEERKMKVILVNPPQSPVMLPSNVGSRENLHSLSHQDAELAGIENLPPPVREPEAGFGLENVRNSDEVQSAKDIDSVSYNDKGGQLSSHDMVEPKLAVDFEVLKSELNEMDFKLKEADHKIMKLTDERKVITREKDVLRHELELLRKNHSRRNRAGFPLLFVCMVALISLVLGYVFHPSVIYLA